MTVPGLRVVDLTTGIPGGYASKLLLDAGADVCKVEPPGGDPLRRWSATGADLGGEDGALFRFLHAGKRCVVGSLDDASIEHDVLGADIVLEDLAPGQIERHDLTARAPHLVVVSISPWGRGPWADRPATEFTLQAESGSLGRRGRPERQPVQIGGRLGDWITGVVAGVGALAAASAARETGRGAHVDVAAFDSMVLTMNTYAWLLGSFTGDVPERTARTVEVPSIEPTADGYVGFCTVAAQQFQDLLVLIGAEQWLGDPAMAGREGRWTRREEFLDALHAYTSTRTTAEVLAEASAFRIPVAPIANGSTVTQLEAFQGRESFAVNPQGGFVQPAVPYRLHGVDEPPLSRGWRASGAARAAATGVPATTPATANATVTADRPLAGLKVVDLTAWWAGPVAANVLAQLGADVVKVESVQRPDGMRFSTSRTPADESWWEWGSTFHGANSGKRGITADLRRPEGLEIVRRLIEDSDVLIENFTPRVVESFGLGWDAVSAINPRIVMTRMPAFGLTGAWRDRPGFAQTMEQASGMAHLTGHRDEPMQIPRGPCDPLAGLHAVFATLLALEERRASGVGRLVEVTMIDAALNAGAEQIVECTAYGRLLERDGNRSAHAAPQGLYPGPGVDEWLAVSIETDAQWAGLQRVLGGPAWAASHELADLAGRRGAHDRIDREIARWSCARPVADSVATLLDAGVPAAALLGDRTLGSHPSLQARGFFAPIHHAVTGTHLLPQLPFRVLGHERPGITRPAPLLGQHNSEVLHELGYSTAEIARLERSDVIGDRPLG